MSGVKEKHFEDIVFNYLGGNSVEQISPSPLYQSKVGLCEFDFATLLWKQDLERFIRATQPLEWKKLEKQFPGSEIDNVAEELHKLRHKRGILNILREGFTLQGINIRLAFFKPSMGLSQPLLIKYKENRFTIVRQFHYSSQFPEKSLDLIILLNGIPLFTFELKNEFTGQNVQHAIEQYCKRRDSRDPFLKACLVHFAVDHTSAFMTTKLNNGETNFLPFNRDTHNPGIDGKFATSYLWEDILQADSLLTLLQNYIHYEYNDKKNEEKLIFPRFHQYDVVRLLIKNVRQKGVGQNYLIQHSAGSGKSNSIAWLAHQLANLCDENDNNFFDSIIVITDRKILDKQLQATVKQFEKIKGTVRKIDKNAKQLLKALEDGDRIIISTLQKFGFIGDLNKGKLNGKRFAIIVDEAHSSQTGENIKDLKMALTTEESLRKIVVEDEENQESKDDLTEELEKVMASRQKLPHLSFFAFTATPKDKTLQLFGIPDQNKKSGFRPFHLYTMRQAIEEGFIFNVLDNYVTFKSYFELLENEKAEEEKKFEEIKVKRLLLTEVNKHPHSIRAKSHIMLHHFMEKTVHKINGKAKAMVVTSSRAHAVLYKKAFDDIIKELNYPIKCLVAFSGSVQIGDAKYTEESMNPKDAKDIASAFDKSDYRILIVANKFQTGFDQPLLHTMYVDKKLGGIATVQTLSRLNRKGNPAKKDTLVLDFANTQEEVQGAFQDYYQETLLDKATDPQKLYNLKYEIKKMDVFSEEDLLHFGEMFVVMKVKSEKLSSFFRTLVDDNYERLNKEDKEKYRGLVNKYIRQYSFISQIITFIDKDLELFYLFAKLLYKYLPYEKETLPLEVVQMVDMNKFRIQEEQNGSILLKSEDTILKNKEGDGHKQRQPYETDYLVTIVNELNQLYQIDFDEADKVVNGLKEKLIKDKKLEESFMADNIDEVKRLNLERSIKTAFLSNVDDYLGFMARAETDKAFGKFFMNQMYHWYKEQMRQQP